MNGLDHILPAVQGLRLQLRRRADAGHLDGHRHARGPPDRHDRRLRRDRRRRHADAADDDPQGHGHGRQRGLAGAGRRSRSRARRSISAADGVHHDRHPGRATPKSRSTRSGASGRSTTARRSAGRPRTRRARRATTATSTPTAIVAPPDDPKAPALVVGVWMGNCDNSPEHATPSRSTRPRRSGRAIMRRGHARARRSPTSSSRRASSPRRSTRSAATSPVRGTTKTSPSSSSRAPSRRRPTTSTGRVDIDAASGLLWQDGCVGPKKTVGALDFSQVEASLPELAASTTTAGRGGRPAAPGVGGGAEGHPHRVLLRHGLLPVRPDLGRDLRPERALPAGAAADAAAVRQPLRAVLPAARRRPTPSPSPGPGKRPKP